MKKYEHYRFRDGITMLDEQEFNSRFFDLDGRLHILEAAKSSIDESIGGLVNIGIERIDGAIVPRITQLNEDRIQALAQLNAELAAFQTLSQTWLNDLQALYEIFQDPVLELSQIKAWQGLLDPQGNATILPDKLRGGSVAISYDTGGRVSELITTLPYGIYKLSYAYGANGNVSSETAMLNGNTLWTKTYQYNAQGRLDNIIEEPSEPGEPFIESSYGKTTWNIISKIQSIPGRKIIDRVDAGWYADWPTYQADTADYILGAQSGKLITTTQDGAEYFARAQRDLSPAQYIGDSSTIGFWVKLPDNATALILRLLCPDWSNVAMKAQYNFPPSIRGGWTFMSLPLETFQKIGSPNFADVRSILIEIRSAVNTCTASFDGFCCAPNTFNNGAIIITFDDCNSTDYDIAKSIMDAYGYRGCSFVTTDNIGSNEWWLSLPQLHKMQDLGWDICSHTKSHPYLTGLSEAERLYEIVSAKRWLIEKGFHAGARFLAYPYSDADRAVHNIAKQYHYITRLVRGEVDAVNGYHGWPLLNPYTIAAEDSANVPVATLQAWVNQVKAKWGLGVILFHRLVEGSPGPYQYSAADFQTFIDHIYDQGVPVITMSDLIDKYLLDKYLINTY